MKKSDYAAMRSAVIKGRGMGWDIIDVEYLDAGQVDDQSVVNGGGVVSAVRMAIGAGSVRSDGIVGALAANMGCRKTDEYDCAMRLEVIVSAYNDNVLVVPVAFIGDGGDAIALVSVGWSQIGSYLKFLDGYGCAIDAEDAMWESAWKRNSSAQAQLAELVREDERRRAEAEAKAADEADQLEFLSLIKAFEAKAD